MSPFAWQRNKGILFYLTPNSASKSQFRIGAEAEFSTSAPRASGMVSIASSRSEKALKEVTRGIRQSLWPRQREHSSRSGERTARQGGTRLSQQQPGWQSASVCCRIWSLSSRDAGVDTRQSEPGGPLTTACQGLDTTHRHPGTLPQGQGEGEGEKP